MKKTTKKVISIMLIVILLLSLSSCDMIITIKKFYFKNIKDHLDEDYFTSENFDCARVDSVVIVPHVFEIYWGVFCLRISAYSKTGEESVIIKNAVIKENDNVLLTYELNKEINFEQTDDLLFMGMVHGKYDNMTFTEEQVEVVKGKEYDFVVEVEVTANGKTLQKSITFVLAPITYITLNMP